MSEPLTPVPAGHIAAIVTYLEMTRRPAPVPLPESELRMEEWDRPDLDSYRALFERVGAPWLWFSRLVMDDAALAAILHDPAVRIWAVLDADDGEAGMLELDLREAGQCEIGFLGLVPELAGRGHGRWLMAQALHNGWREDVRRVWLHSCTLDHPRALKAYARAGFTAYERAIETFPDPRLAGHLPRDAAPRVPIIG